MTRINAILTALFLALFVGACESNIDNTDDTGTPVESMTIMIDAMLGNDVIDGLDYTIEDTAEVIAEGVTGEPLSVKLRNEARIQLGALENDLTADGYRIVTVDGIDYVNRKATIDTDTSENPVTVSLISYFVSGDAVCTMYNGDTVMYEYNEGSVETEQGYILRLDEHLGNGSWLEFDGTSFEIKGDKEDMPFVDMEVGNDYLAYAMVDEAFDVRHDFVCEF
ncbi:hypothetical protein HN358_02115 [Candidatus Uhrbacteria bacterium]|nr:hypothetical protein [Candidatus Uhrbacteria bacterium]MBT7716899.1 hypothetical protein [Candidatus Uhrbacteria bacterium]